MRTPFDKVCEVVPIVQSPESLSSKGVTRHLTMRVGENGSRYPVALNHEMTLDARKSPEETGQAMCVTIEEAMVCGLINWTLAGRQRDLHQR